MSVFHSFQKFKIDFQDGGDGFPTGNMLDIFIYKLPRYFVSSFKLIRLSVQREEFQEKNKMADITAISDCQSELL